MYVTDVIDPPYDEPWPKEENNPLNAMLSLGALAQMLPRWLELTINLTTGKVAPCLIDVAGNKTALKFEARSGDPS